jgi:hypothetical protein
MQYLTPFRPRHRGADTQRSLTSRPPLPLPLIGGKKLNLRATLVLNDLAGSGEMITLLWSRDIGMKRLVSLVER